MISKYFLPPNQGAERELVDTILKRRAGQDVSIYQTRYFKLRTAQADWKSPGFARLPDGLDLFPPYWFMPWKGKERKPIGFYGKFLRRVRFNGLYMKFEQLLDGILQDGYRSDCPPIKGDCLVHPDHGEIFIYTDGNQRMGILSYLAEQKGGYDFEVPVKIESRTHRDDILRHPTAEEGLKKGYFSKADVLRWFDHPFDAMATDEPI
ncbi:MAG TPA: hypothetical protein PK876_09035 [Elusimicrobiota bacterium]|nr:hypothetical protein [Elusimicrobiota bacterium]